MDQRDLSVAPTSAMLRGWKNPRSRSGGMDVTWFIDTSFGWRISRRGRFIAPIADLSALPFTPINYELLQNNPATPVGADSSRHCHRADKSAVGAVNRPLRRSLRSACRYSHYW